MLYVVLQRYQGLLGSSMINLSPGTIIDDENVDVDQLIEGGAALYEYIPEMESSLTRFQSAMVQGAGDRDALPFLSSQGFVGLQRGSAIKLLHVDPSVSVHSSMTRDGSIVAPFATIQDAVDYVSGVSPPSSNTNRYGLLIAPGVYAENVVIKCDGIALMGYSYGSVEIRPASGCAVTVTNASLASLAVYNSSGDYADLEYVTGDPVPADIVLSNISCDQVDTTPALRLLGVKGDETASTTMFGWDNTNFAPIGLYNVLCQGTNTTLYARNCGMIDARLLTCGGTVEIYNNWYHHVIHFDFDDHVVEQNDASPYGTHEMGHLELRYGYGYHSDITMNGSVDLRLENHAVTGVINPNGTSELDARLVRIMQDLDMDDTATATMEGGHIGRDVLAEAGTTITLRGVHVQRHMTLVSGAGVVTMDGGRIMGTVTDTGTRLTHTQGAIGT